MEYSSSDYRNFQLDLEDGYSFTEVKITKLFKSFEAGWSYGEGVPFKEEIITLATELNKRMNLAGFLETNAFPGTDGSIMVTLYADIDNKKECLEFTIHEDKKITFVREEGNLEIKYADNLTFKDAVKEVFQFREERCSSESSTQFYTTKSVDDTLAKFLPRLAITEGFLSSRNNAPLRTALSVGT